MNKLKKRLFISGLFVLTQFGITNLSANEVLVFSADNFNTGTTTLYQQPNDGEYWWLANNSRRWLYRHCAQSHIDAGETVGIVEYSVLESIPRDDGPCPAIRDNPVTPDPETPNPETPDPEPPSPDTPDPTTSNLFQQPNDGEYWWLVNNTRRWLYRHCAQKHIDAGETVAIIEYSVLKTIARDDGPCPAVRDNPGTPDPGTPDPETPDPETPHPDTPVGKEKLETLRNNNPLFRQHEALSSLDLTGLGFYHDGFTEPSPVPDNGASPQGQFRIGCQYSHFAYDDPIVKPSQPGQSHLHMFWGNTGADAFTVFDESAPLGDPNNIMESGGSTCQGFELNRSAYWMPALLTSKHSPRSIVVPDDIVIYYKSHRPKDVNPLPAGIQFLAGNVSPGAVMQHSFTPNGQLFWSCGRSGSISSISGTIPTNCKAGEYINATISFPQCLAIDRNGNPVLSSPDFMSHARMVSNTAPCPASHPYRVPQISYLVYFPNGTDGAGAGVSNWVLSSDHGVPGGSLHGDWLGGWHDSAIQKWIDGCYDPTGSFSGPRNCSIGQTGRNGSHRQFRRVSRLNDYDGPNFLSLD